MGWVSALFRRRIDEPRCHLCGRAVDKDADTSVRSERIVHRTCAEKEWRRETADALAQLRRDD